MKQWNPVSPRSWADALGLAYVPLFGASGSASAANEHAVLLDGAKASFHIVATADADVIDSDQNLHWSWSSNLLHTLGIDTRREVLLLRRWDTPDHYRRFKLPTRQAGAQELLDVIRTAPPPRSADVVLHMLRAFRAIRVVIDEPVASVRLFNLCLTIAEAVEENKITDADVLVAATFRDLMNIGEAAGLPEWIAATNAEALPNSVLNQRLGVLLQYFLEPEPQQQYRLKPSLLLRHASGQLYQEAHLVLEREQTQMFPGLIADAPGTLVRRDVRFTPPTLARSLVEQAFDVSDSLKMRAADLRIIDPACGSGVFLLEAVRELVALGHRGHVALNGIDISPISTSAASFCLHHAKREAELAGMTITATVETADALASEWHHPDIVLMNPPFIAWEAMTTPEQGQVQQILGDAWHGRSDKSMAFVKRAVDAVANGGIVASVLSAPMLESSFGERWRKDLTSEASLRFVGRFSGFGYFRASLVEPAFLVLERHQIQPPDLAATSVTVVLAEEGSEDEALRALRLYRHAQSAAIQEGRYEIFETPATVFTPASWTPRTRKRQELIDHASQLGMPRVGDLFEINQGAKTGADKVFVLTRLQFESLPRAEQKMFRPVASSSTIRNGRLLGERWIFFPYGVSGLLLKSEAEVAKVVPTYYTQYLRPARQKLQSRAKVDPDIWWKLTWEREWQHQPSPKIVTATWGDKGSFSYDNTGDFVVVQGLAWHWRADKERDAVVDADETSPSFHETELPWAYLAVLNSGPFELLLSAICPRVQGGQFDLSLRFVGRAMLPDLSDETRTPADVVSELARAGRALHDGKQYPHKRLDDAVARMYGVEPGST